MRAAGSIGFRARVRRAGLAAALAAVLLIPASAAADQSQVAVSPANEARSDAGPLWTKQRMRSAPPLDAEASGPAIDSRRAERLGRAAGAGPQLLAAGAAPSATVDGDRVVRDYLRYPSRAHGRIFATTPGLGDFTCSGTLVSSRGENLVFTAGHCLYHKESGQYASDVVFVPAYRNGDRPYGAYSATQLFVLNGWRGLPIPDAYSYDVAAMTLDQPLERLIGARGLKTDVNPRRKTFDIFGYPARPDPPYDGERPIHCPRADFQFFEDRLYPVRNPSIAAGPCYMQQGSSGGGWVLDGGFVNSVVSHGFCDAEPGLCGVIHGPYFDGNASSLYAEAGGGNRRPSDSAACTPLERDREQAKRERQEAKKKLRKAKRKLRRAKRKGTKGEVRKAKRRVRRAKKRLERAQRDYRRAKRASDALFC